MSYITLSIDLHQRNTTTGALDALSLIRDALTADGQWDWSLQRHLDADTRTIRESVSMSVDDDAYIEPWDIVSEWENRATSHGFTVDTDEGILTVSNDPDFGMFDE